MASLIRRLSRRLSRKDRGDHGAADGATPKGLVTCKVTMLDGQVLTIELPRKCQADALYKKVFFNAEVVEEDYFGLQFTDHRNVSHWLDPLKSLRKQVTIGPPYCFRFRVKFYSSDPNTHLKNELTRYFLFLQLKQDILTGKLEVHDQDKLVELCGLALQSELGDYDADAHTPAFISQFRFVPDQTEQLELKILEQYKLCEGRTPDRAESEYLSKAKWLDMYGVDMHVVQGRDSSSYRLGLTPTGILVFDGPTKIGLFFWPKITKLSLKIRKFIIVVIEEDDSNNQQEHEFVFRLHDEKACKHLWKCAVEYHSFFRLTKPATRSSARSGFIRNQSRFRASTRTEAQMRAKNTPAGRSSTGTGFQRMPSQRFEKRPAFVRQEHEQQRQAAVGSPSTATSTFTSTSTSKFSARTEKEHADYANKRLRQLKEVQHNDEEEEVAPSGDVNLLLNNSTADGLEADADELPTCSTSQPAAVGSSRSGPRPLSPQEMQLNQLKDAVEQFVRKGSSQSNSTQSSVPPAPVSAKETNIDRERQQKQLTGSTAVSSTSGAGGCSPSKLRAVDEDWKADSESQSRDTDENRKSVQLISFDDDDKVQVNEVVEPARTASGGPVKPKRHQLNSDDLAGAKSGIAVPSKTKSSSRNSGANADQRHSSGLTKPSSLPLTAKGAAAVSNHAATTSGRAGSQPTAVTPARKSGLPTPSSTASSNSSKPGRLARMRLHDSTTPLESRETSESLEPSKYPVTPASFKTEPVYHDDPFKTPQQPSTSKPNTPQPASSDTSTGSKIPAPASGRRNSKDKTTNGTAMSPSGLPISKLKQPGSSKRKTSKPTTPSAALITEV